jgi:hypothetical protein|tara:strand:+ start:10379 stop:10702 length:324 start_codon:yes stop_codon:yes gene_type:complete
MFVCVRRKGTAKKKINFFWRLSKREEEEEVDEKEENERKRHALREEEEERDRHVWATRSSTSERVDEHHREWPERVSLVRVQRQQSEKEGEQNDRSSNPSGKTSGTT